MPPRIPGSCAAPCRPLEKPGMIAWIAACVCSGDSPNWLARLLTPSPPCAAWMISLRFMQPSPSPASGRPNLREFQSLCEASDHAVSDRYAADSENSATQHQAQQRALDAAPARAQSHERNRAQSRAPPIEQHRQQGKAEIVERRIGDE